MVTQPTFGKYSTACLKHLCEASFCLWLHGLPLHLGNLLYMLKYRSIFSHTNIKKIKDIDRPNRVIAMSPTKYITLYLDIKSYNVYLFWEIIKLRFVSLYLHSSFDHFVETTIIQSDCYIWSNTWIHFCFNSFIFAHKDFKFAINLYNNLKRGVSVFLIFVSFSV